MPDSALSIAPIANSPGDLIASSVKAAKTWLVVAAFFVIGAGLIMLRLGFKVVGALIVAIGSGAGDRPSQRRLKVRIQIAGVEKGQQPGDLVRCLCTQLATLEGLLARGGYLASRAANAS